MTVQTIEITDKSVFRFWCLQKPNARKLLHEIIFKWRNTSARIPGEPGKWCVYPVPQWCQWTGLSSDQAERALKELEAQGFIRRERRRFQGKTFRAFLQPTPMALEYMGRPDDLKRLGGAGKADAAGIDAGTAAGMAAGIDAGIAAATFTPSLPTKKNLPYTIPPCEGGASGEIDVEEYKAKLQNAAKAYLLTGVHEAEFDHEDRLFIEHAAKKLKKLTKNFPIIKGPHEPYVWHPSQKYVDWSDWSEPLRAQKQALYEKYVANWYKKHKGLSPVSVSPQPVTEEPSATPESVAKPQPKKHAPVPSASYAEHNAAYDAKQKQPETMEEIQAIMSDEL